jgi:myosin heavy subunit
VIGKDIIKSPLTIQESYNSRDAMAKAIYGKMFNWIVKRINDSISLKMNAKSSKDLKFIGLLDIFGFEIFKENSF